jgi:hypothetical protein
MTTANETGQIPEHNNFVEEIIKAGEAHLKEVSKETRKSYISRATWDKIEDRQRAHTQCDTDRVNRLKHEIARSAKQDKQKQHHQQIQTRRNRRY